MKHTQRSYGITAMAKAPTITARVGTSIFVNRRQTGRPVSPP